MRVSLVRPTTDDPSVVGVAAEGVSGTGHWRGTSAPAAESDVDVEFEVTEEVGWGDIAIAPPGASSLVPAPGELLLQGVVEDVDQYGVLTLRIANAVLLIDTVGEPPLHVIGERVAIVARHAEIYPTGA